MLPPELSPLIALQVLRAENGFVIRLSSAYLFDDPWKLPRQWLVEDGEEGLPPSAERLGAAILKAEAFRVKLEAEVAENVMSHGEMRPVSGHPAGFPFGGAQRLPRTGRVSARESSIAQAVFPKEPPGTVYTTSFDAQGPLRDAQGLFRAGIFQVLQTSRELRKFEVSAEDCGRVAERTWQIIQDWLADGPIAERTWDQHRYAARGAFSAALLEKGYPSEVVQSLQEQLSSYLNHQTPPVEKIVLRGIREVSRPTNERLKASPEVAAIDLEVPRVERVSRVGETSVLVKKLKPKPLQKLIERVVTSRERSGFTEIPDDTALGVFHGALIEPVATEDAP